MPPRAGCWSPSRWWPSPRRSSPSPAPARRWRSARPRCPRWRPSPGGCRCWRIWPAAWTAASRRTVTISDRASPELKEARDRVRGLHRSIKGRLDELLHDEGFAPNLRESYYTLRNGRYVVPVLAQHRPEVPGIVHNASQTGQTLFVEPQAMVGLGNDLAIAQSLVLEEERRLLQELSDQVGREAARDHGGRGGVRGAGRGGGRGAAGRGPGRAPPGDLARAGRAGADACCATRCWCSGPQVVVQRRAAVRRGARAGRLRPQRGRQDGHADGGGPVRADAARGTAHPGGRGLAGCRCTARCTPPWETRRTSPRACPPSAPT